MIVGRVREIWRYPVKSMGGESLDRCDLELRGIPGDRGWALRDDGAGEIRGGKYLPRMMECSARYRKAPTATDIPHVDITMPDGNHVGSDDPELSVRLSKLLGRSVSLWPIRPASDRRHYKRVQAGGFLLAWMSRSGLLRSHIGTVIRLAGMNGRTRALFSREDDEPLPDFSLFPSDLFEFTSPPGTYFDAFPIHLLTTASLDAMARLNRAAVWDVRRFRPNLLIETGAGTDGFVETSWQSGTLRVGNAAIRCEIPTVRCGMTIQAQNGLSHDPTILRTIVREADQTLGIYASPVNAGSMAVGDVVTLE